MWKKLVNERNFINIFWTLCILFFVVLFGVSFVTSGITPDSMDETVYFVQDNLFGNLVGLLCVICLGVICVKMQDKWLAKCNMDLCAGVFCVIIWALSVYWIFASKTMPGADQASLWAEAMKLEQGDISGFAQGGYLTRCPQQLGLVTLIRVIIKIFGLENYKAIQYCLSIAIPVLVYAGYQVLKRLVGENKLVYWFYLLAMLLCAPLYGYAPFVYGEILSTAFILLSAWFFMDCLQNCHWKKIVPFAISIGCAVLFRQNALIFVIAYVIVLFVKIIVQFSWKYVITGLACILGVLVIQGSINLMYSPYMEEDNQAIPAILYVVMGTRDTVPERPGWYDGYNHAVYFEVDGDAEAATKQAYEDLRLFADYCKENPAYAIDFYARKFNSQWNVPTYIALAMNSKIVETQTPLAESIYFGKAGVWVEAFANVYQLVIHGGVLALLVFMRKKWTTLDKYSLLIGIYGGFWFSMLWEAKARYIFPYMLIMIPYAAAGLGYLVQGIYTKYKQSR